MDPKIAQRERSIAQEKVRALVKREVPPLNPNTYALPDPIHLKFIQAVYNPDRRLG